MIVDYHMHLRGPANGREGPIELTVDRSANIDGYSEESWIDILLNHPTALLTNENATDEQIVEHVDEKERIAVGVLIGNARQLFQ